jgi:hypothetical protein
MWSGHRTSHTTGRGCSDPNLNTMTGLILYIIHGKVLMKTGLTVLRCDLISHLQINVGASLLSALTTPIFLFHLIIRSYLIPILRLNLLFPRTVNRVREAQRAIVSPAVGLRAVSSMPNYQTAYMPLNNSTNPPCCISYFAL